MEIEQVEVMIEDAEASLKEALRARTVTLRKSGKEPKKATEAKLQPIEEKI